ncbi:MAG: DEAD/DEAH box helicase [Leptonema illini]|uniref:DEAD/DEAH box helicase n=1 Tax=Leptonema illini TaxID=183 RepID=A0A833GX69_9LEPT|nr:MAG: DEAD/DEAH box helicase [Leptonema illini]
MTATITDYHTKYFAYELTKRCPPDSVEKFAAAVASAQVDLNPHQVDAALFAFKSPFSRGALLADEVGLGKTIEAGLVLSQRWAERKRRILVITPSNLRKQWFQELSEKFFLPCRILESKSYNAAIKQGQLSPFQGPEIVICSYQFAKSKDSDIEAVHWDLVVIDEAHRLRNVYKPSNVIASTLKAALADRHKLLLTATPLQNSLLELFGLVSFIDDQIFGDITTFREQFSDLNPEAFATLKARLCNVCHRTLRRQVSTTIPYTKRLPLLEEFSPDEDERRLYDLVSDYLQRENLQALPAGQRSLITLVLRKLLASSSFAIAGALVSMSTRLKAKLNPEAPVPPLEDDLNEDYEALDETAEEWGGHFDDGLSVAERGALEQEIADLDSFAALASSISRNAKGAALLKALQVAFLKAKTTGAEEKAIIFTESRRTQAYLLELLTQSDFAEGIVLFNGTNTDERSREVYSSWLAHNSGSDRVTGSRTADMRSALVDYFRDHGRIMIATEAGAEGINLQFCSMVVNYDLPWNPQRIEQRIGRCHRYGQKHDVVVVNFLNRENAADQRVFELLRDKFQLFEGVFGASDEVLGNIESGIDFEKRIAAIYQNSRKAEEIQQAFNELQIELSQEIDESLARTRQKLLENFDDEVREKLRVRNEASQANLNRFEKLLMQLTRHELKDNAVFPDDSSFVLSSSPFDDIPLGLYELPRRSGDAHLYRLNHPLAERLLANAKDRVLPPAEIRFDYGKHDGRITPLEDLIGAAGWLNASVFSVESLDQSEDHLILTAQTDEGKQLEDDIARRLLTLPGGVVCSSVAEEPTSIGASILQRQNAIRQQISERNAQFFEAEAAKLDGWADDLKLGLEREIKDLDRQIRDARRSTSAALTLEEKLNGQKGVRGLEAQRSQKRRALFEAQDSVDAQRQTLINRIEGKLAQSTTSTLLFKIRWILE